MLVLSLVKGITDIQSVDEYYLTHMEDIDPGFGDGDHQHPLRLRVLEEQNWNKLRRDSSGMKNTYPRTAVILPETTYVLRQGDTVFDVLKRACQL